MKKFLYLILVLFNNPRWMTLGEIVADLRGGALGSNVNNLLNLHKVEDQVLEMAVFMLELRILTVLM